MTNQTDTQIEVNLNKDIKSNIIEPSKLPSTELNLCNSQRKEADNYDESKLSKKKKSKKRCNHPDCSKKLKLTDVECRCGYIFCMEHRYAEAHCCPVDYKKIGKEQLSSANPLVDFAKVQKI